MRRLAMLALLGCAPLAQADFRIPGYELVQTVPVETTLGSSDLRDPVTVWSELFDGARHEIVLGQFYAASRAGAPFEKVFDRLEAAGRRGVKIRFLLDQKGVGLSEPATLARLRAIPNLELRILDYGKLTGNGIIHAKYLVVDRKAAFIGSQNFDWRSFSQIHETGLLVTDAVLVAQVQAVFERDWQAQGQLAANLAVPRTPPGRCRCRSAPPRPSCCRAPRRIIRPACSTPKRCCRRLLAEAKSEVRVQLLDYAPLSYGAGGSRPYYAVIDNAIRAAAARGVTVKLMVSNWNTEQPAIAYLKSLALVPNVQVRIVTLPAASSGPIPFARVIHSKTMSIDGKIAWVGTSNWSGGYFDKSRNLEVVLRNEKMAQRLAAMHEQAWSSQYAQPLDVNKDYPKPAKGGE